MAKIQQRAQELKKLGGEVPPEVKNIIQNSDIKEKVEKPKAISGFSLVAGKYYLIHEKICTFTKQSLISNVMS